VDSPEKPEKTSHSRTIRVDGEKVRRLRIEKCWSQDVLAQHADISEKTLRRIESGSPVYLATLARIAEVLGVTIDDIRAADSEPERQGVPAGKEPQIMISIQITGDFETFNRESLEQLRAMLSKIAQISPSNVTIKGVEKG
jgi:transcriptional regulator with XRE-family HTH domain